MSHKGPRHRHTDVDSLAIWNRYAVFRAFNSGQNVVMLTTASVCIDRLVRLSVRVRQKSPDWPEVKVHESNMLNLTCRLPVDGLLDLIDLTSCSKFRCLYIAEWNGGEGYHQYWRPMASNVSCIQERRSGNLEFWNACTIRLLLSAASTFQLQQSILPHIIKQLQDK